MSRNDDGFAHYREILGEEQVRLLLYGLARFDDEFRSAIKRGQQFTIRLEAHGNRGELIHCRSASDVTERAVRSDVGDN